MKGRYSWAQALGWIGLILFLALLPLFLAGWRAPPSRHVMVELGASLGLLGLGLLLVQALTSGRLAWVASSFGADNLTHFHRHLGLIGVCLVLGHPLVLLLAEPAFISYLDPRVDLVRALALWLVLMAIVFIAASSLWRLRFGLSYELWRLLHGLLAVVIIVLGTGHALMVDHYLSSPWQKAVLALMAAAGVGTVAWTRLVRPWLGRRRPWRVVSVSPERGQAWTVRLAADGHAGLQFQPGQFAWFSFGSGPMTLQQHPFSLAGSAVDVEIRFTASEAGDFTSSIKHLEPGTKAWLEGPFGSFVPDHDPTTALLMVAGGIGVTPFVSMLETFRDNGIDRRVILVYANPTLEDATLSEALASLAERPGTELVHVLEDPPDDWSGERGLIDESLLQSCLERLADHDGPIQVMTCGPEPVMDQAESVMRRCGIPWQRIFSERFEIV